jgi:hypothetical protein
LACIGSLAIGLLGSAAQAEELPSEIGEFAVQSVSIETVAEAARRAADKLHFFFDRPIQVATVRRSEATPVASVTSRQGTCIVVVNTRFGAQTQWVHFLKYLPADAYEDFLEAAAAHEIGHCLDRQRSSETVRDTQDKETFADAFAMGYAQSFLPERAALLLRTFVRTRRDLSLFDHGHDTATVLQTLGAQLLPEPLSQSEGPGAVILAWVEKARSSK